MASLGTKDGPGLLEPVYTRAQAVAKSPDGLRSCAAATADDRGAGKNQVRQARGHLRSRARIQPAVPHSRRRTGIKSDQERQVRDRAVAPEYVQVIIQAELPAAIHPERRGPAARRNPPA